MRRMSISLALVAASSFALLAGSAPGLPHREPHRGGRDTVWVANRDANRLTVLDADSGEVQAEIPVGRGAHNVVISKREAKAYITEETDATVSVYSTETLQLLKTLPVGAPGSLPHHAHESADGRSVYVGLFGTNTIARIDTATDQFLVFPSSTRTDVRAHAPRPSFDDSLVYVPHETGNLVTTLDARTGAILSSINPGTQPTEVLPTRDGRFLYVAMRGEGKVKIVDLSTGGLDTREITVGTSPEALILTEDEHTLIVSLRGSPAQLAIVDTCELQLASCQPSLGTSVPLAGPGTSGDLAVVSHNGRYVYATFDRGATGLGGVAVVDVHRRTKVDTWDFQTAGRLHGIAYSTGKLE